MIKSKTEYGMVVNKVVTQCIVHGSHYIRRTEITKKNINTQIFS